MVNKTLPILLVEDNPDHAELIKISIRNNNLANDIIHLKDGEQAIDYIFKKGEYAERSDVYEPVLILLDLRMPKMDGLEVLKIIKTNESTKHIPVIVLTTSANEADVIQAYKYHVNSYLVKPVSFESFAQLMKKMGFYWLVLNKKNTIQNNE